jgi:pimeloyl-ACP methyl ester carboxylesterase
VAGEGVQDERAGTAGGRRGFLTRSAVLAGTATLGAGSSLAAGAAEPAAPPSTGSGLAPVVGREYEAIKQVDGMAIKLSVWRKRLAPGAARPTGRLPAAPLLFIHGSSTAGRASFDLQVPGKPVYSAMDWFARLGYDVWCFDHEGYGKSDKRRQINADVATGADDILAVSDLILRETGAAKAMMYGMSSGALRAGLFAQRHPERVARLALDALVWTGEGSPTLTERRKRIDQWRSSNRRPLDRALVESIFTRDHPGTADADVVRAFADALIAQDNTVPTGTYLDMTANLPVNDPTKITVPTIVMRGQWDGIATLEDVLGFFSRLPNPDRQFTIMPGIAHSSMHEKNVEIVFNILDGFLRRPAPRYLG